MEEIVVTGSYIRYADTFDAASPLRTIDREYMEDQGLADSAYILLDLPYVMGSNTRPGMGGGNLGGYSNINLRGLGAGNTLRLINGKRFEFTNNNHIAPGIALARVETLLDGASALYGTDAVAGVVNFITRDDFEGVEVMVHAMNDDDTHKLDETTLSLLMGREFEKGHVTLAYEQFEHGVVTLNDRDLPNAGDSFFGKTYRLRQFFNPIALGVAPAFAEAYRGIAGFNQDLNCADDPGGVPNHSGIACGATYAGYFPVSSDEDRKILRLAFDYYVTDQLNLYGNMNLAHATTTTLVSDLPWTTFTPIIPATNPGLIEDARRRGVPAGTPLTALQFFGRNNLGLPGRTTSYGNEFMGIETAHENHRFALGLKGALPGTDDWMFDASVQYVDWDTREYQRNDFLRDNVELALQGLGGPACDASSPANIANAALGLENVNGSGCYFYNPFLNAQYTETGAVQTDPRLRNDKPGLIDWMRGDQRTNQKLGATVIDFVATGDLAEFRGRPVGAALGAQYRKTEFSIVSSPDLAEGNFAFTSARPPWRNTRVVRAVFAELALPVAETIDVQLALRYEDYTDENLSSTDPKVAVLWQPRDDLAIRGSFSTAFRAPDVDQLNPEFTINYGESLADPLNGGATFNLPVTLRGNANLKPYEATVWNAGFSWYPDQGWLENLRIDLDYFYHDYTNLVVTQSAQALINADPTGPQISRADTGLIENVEVSFLNAGESKQAGVEVSIGYNWETNSFGTLGVSADALRLTRMDLTLYNAGCDCFDEIDGLGRRNHDNPFGAIQDLKVNIRLNWTLQRHSASVTWRHLGSYTNTGTGTPAGTRLLELERGYSCLNADGSRNTNGAGCKIDSHSTFDVQYNYQLPDMGSFENPGTLTLGAINVTDEEPPAVAMDQGFDVTSHDPRGRLWYVRYRLAL